MLQENVIQVQTMARQHESISLLPAEFLLRQLMLECRCEMLPDPAASKLEIWFTGGWVRDKLLGIQTMDVDAALSSMTGMQFGEALKEFHSRNEVRYTQQAEKLGVPPEFKGFHKVERRPHKSKHLETGICHIFGLDLDLVNLRDETYTENSRNPRMEFATAKEDALRRDATVNALFYNIDTQQIEDLTGKGMHDMATGIIRTPLDPYQTFKDDPLRVLRVIRFASKLGYRIEDEAKKSLKDKSIHTALNAKISRERVGTELTKIINSRNPLMAFQLIYESGLYSTVFLNPNGQSRLALTKLLPHGDAANPWPRTWPHAYRVLAALFEDTSKLGRELTRYEENREFCWMMAAYAPVAELRRTNIKELINDLREALKLTTKTAKLLDESLKHMDNIQSTVDLVASYKGSVDDLPRSTIGMALRSWGKTWRLQVLYSLLAEVVYEPSDQDFFVAQITRYSMFVECVSEQNLQDAYSAKLILDGNDVKRLFKLEKPGPFMENAMNRIAEWQFDNRNGSKDEAKEWLRAQREGFGIPCPADEF